MTNPQDLIKQAQNLQKTYEARFKAFREKYGLSNERLTTRGGEK